MKTIGRLILALTMTMVLAGVGNAGTTLEFPTYQATEPGFDLWWKEAIARFEQGHPDVKIQLSQVPFETHHDKMMTRLAAGNPPDIVHLSARFYFGLASRRLLEPLDSYLASENILKDWAALQQTMIVGGKTYAMMLSAYSYGLYYNEQMLKEAGVSVPKTMEELRQAAQRLNNPPTRYGIAMTTSSQTDMYMEITRFLAGFGGEWAPNGKLAVNSPKAVQAVSFFRDLVQAGYAPRNQASTQARLLFWSGKSAMIIDGSWILAMKGNAADAVKTAARVVIPPFEKIPSGPANVIGMAASLDPAKKKLVWDFLKILASPDMQQKYAELTKQPAPLKGSVTPSLVTKIPEMGVFDKYAALASISYLPKDHEKEFDEISKVLIDAFSEALATPRDTKAILDDAQQKIESRLK